MNSISEPFATSQRRNVVPAANTDQLGEHPQPSVNVTQTASGWDAYEVWRRFIKDARDRRQTGRE